MFRNVCRTCWNKYVDKLEQKINKRILPPISVPSSKKDIDVLANEVHSVITKSYEAACPMQKSLRKEDKFWWNSELASLRKEAHRALRKAWNNQASFIIHSSIKHLVDNLFMRPEDTEMIANICSFERMVTAINKFQTFKALGLDGLYLVLLQKGWK